MTSEEILRALQAGKISLEEAKKALTVGTSSGTVQDMNPTGQEEALPGSMQSTIPREEEPVKRARFAQETGRKGAIAIVGMSGRYPDASSLSDFWDNLVQGKNAIREISLSRFNIADYYGPNPEATAKISCKWLGALDGIEYFDPLFFRISPAEAERMDPQQRLFLEEGYKAFEDAGYSPGLLSNSKCGVYLGIMSHEYGLLLSEHKASETDLFGTNSAIAAARIAYLLNLKGPAIAIDTACSSSLVATHLACQALRCQEIDMALVGGVNLCLAPGFYVRLCHAGMLSPDGQCKTFDASANGFVPGEGVGAVVLKRLADAEADHDQIYGVIIGSGTNQDGATNGITAPSVKSQIELEREIYGNSQIDPASISYVEMHGTGTKLGDPIELEALSTVFQEKTQRKQYCAIGSVKSNIGHTLTAAGIAGLQKVLLAMKQKKLVPTLHFEQPNEHFNFETSPFYVNTTVQDWKSEAGGPLRAAVSSFGFSGTNAHLVVEEYIPALSMSRGDGGAGLAPAHGFTPSRPLRSPGACLFVLSAKSEHQLKSYAQEMKHWIQAHLEQALSDIAFTLQLGRDAMNYRLAIVTDSREVLLQRLEEFVDNRASTGVHTGQIGKGTTDAVLFEEDSDGQSLLHIWLQKKNLAKIAQVWVRGVNIDWKLLYGKILPHRVSLPTYPFTHKRYWIPIEACGEADGGKPRPHGPLPGANSQVTADYAVLHPLLQRNTSTLWEQRFSSTFCGEEFFLADHVIKEQRIMPGVAYLEMARVAVRESIGADAASELSRLHLNNVVWAHPLVVGEQAVTVHITLTPQENGTIAFLVSRDVASQLYTTEGSDPRESTGRGQAPSLLCQGIAELHAENPDELSASQSLDLLALQTRCRYQISATECYQRSRELSLNYGPAMQGIEQLSVGEGEVLVRLRLPIAPGRGQAPTLQAPGGAQTRMEGDRLLPYVLHPSVLDAALHASIGLLMDQSQQKVLMVPFALSELSIEGWVPTEGWAWVRRSPSSTTGSVFDIEVCDDAGHVAVRLRGLSLRQLSGNWESLRTRLLTPDWKEEAIPRSSLSQEASLPAAGEGLAPSLILLCDLPDILASRIQAQMVSDGHSHGLKVTSWHSSQSRRELRFQDAVVQLIRELRELWQSRPALPAASNPQVPVLVQVVVAHREESSLLEALTGVLKVAQQEYPALRGQLIEIEGEIEEEELLAYLLENQCRPHEPHVCYRDGQRWVRQWQEYLQVSAPVSVPWKEGGCYLISGGAGGLARLFVQEIARQVQDVTVILVGRSALSQEQRVQLNAVGVGIRNTDHSATGGIHIDYQQVDVSDGPAVHALIQRILAQYGHLDGIIHAAGVLHDSLLLNKTPEEVQAVLAPKVVGVEQLDEATAEIPLDFFVLCSSIAAVVGSVGQADYAAANAYLDAFAHARQAMVMAGGRQGATVSINWPLWQAGGMQMDPSTLQTMQERLGIEAMGTEVGMKILYQALVGGHAQVIVLHGQVERMQQQLLRRSPVSPVGAAPVERVADYGREGEQGLGSVPADKLLKVLSHIVSDLLKVRVEEIDAETPLTEYGFDSITFMRFANRLNQTYQLDLTPPLFYEYSTVERLVHYLQTTSAAVPAPHFAVASPLALGAAEQMPAVPAVVRQRPRVDHRFMSTSEHKTSAAASAIAIIGVSGKFPLSPDMQSLWSNLLAGKDCIGEMPAARWDWQTNVGDRATSNPNKTDIKWAGVMDDVELFDPLFFGISPREAEQMDPQQRLLMMYVWKAIEDAGYSPESLSGTNTALFIGTMNSGYSEQLSRAGGTIESYSSTGQTPSVGPNRMSYFLDLHGPSEPIETACSSSLVAIHRGVAAIESGQCNTAIVGGVNILVSPELHISFSKAGMLSPDGHCKPFSASANGYVRGEGVGMLVLKKLVLAEQDGDHIYGVIRGSAENHSGRASSLTAPNPRAQADLLIAAYRKAGIDPRTVGYIEAHGTGTALGDPIEINGLKSAFSELSEKMGEGPMQEAVCGIGSVKSNIGHLELAAGVAGVIKVLLQMQHKKLVKSLHCEQVNPYIQLEGSPFYIVQENRDWEALRDNAGNVLPRRAGISSFGFGGANAHVVLEEYVPKPRVKLSGSAAQSPALIVLSARNEERLHEQVQQFLTWVQTEMSTGELQDWHKARSLQDVAYTLQVGRSAMEERLAFNVHSLAELEEKLRSYLQEPQEEGDWYRGQARRYKEMGALFSADEELQEAISQWLQRGKYEKLLQWWVEGGTIDWQILYIGAAGSAPVQPSRISLPTYPFARERYWVSTPKVELMSNGASPTIVTTHTLSSGTTSLSIPLPNSSQPMASKRVALRPLADLPLLSRKEADRSQSPISPSLSCQSFSQSGSNGVGDSGGTRVSLTIGRSTMAAANMQTALSVDHELAPQLEDELVRSLAQALYMEESAIDVEKPFGEMGLDSVVGVDWVQSLNKQYASNLKASSVYDYPTIRQLAGFLQEEWLKRQQMPVQPISAFSLDDILQKVQQRDLDPEEAKKQLLQFL